MALANDRRHCEEGSRSSLVTLSEPGSRKLTMQMIPHLPEGLALILIPQNIQLIQNLPVAHIHCWVSHYLQNVRNVSRSLEVLQAPSQSLTSAACNLIVI